jgi:hypothetical protein
MLAEYEGLFIATGFAVVAAIVGLMINSVGSDISKANYRKRKRKHKPRNKAFYGVTSLVSGTMEIGGGLSAILGIGASLLLIPSALIIGSCAGITEGGRAIGAKEIVQAPPSRLPEGSLRGLDPVVVRGDSENGRGAKIVIYGKRVEGAFYPKAYRARFWGVPIKEKKYEAGTIPRNGIWSMSVASASGLSPATVSPRNEYIRADGRWQSGWTTNGSFAIDETAEVSIVIGDTRHYVEVPVALSGNGSK